MIEYTCPEWINRVPKEYQNVFKRHDMWVKGVEDGKKAVLRWTNLEGFNLEGANLEGANFYRADLRGAHLKGVYLHGANLRWADLERANLRGANLEGANLRGANLQGANLKGADLQRADLRRANLYRTNLEGADLYRTNLEGADLHRVSLKGAKNINQFGPVGEEWRIGYAVKHENCIMVQLGCFWDTEERAIEAIEKKYGKDSAYAALVSAACRALSD